MLTFSKTIFGKLFYFCAFTRTHSGTIIHIGFFGIIIFLPISTKRTYIILLITNFVRKIYRKYFKKQLDIGCIEYLKILKYFWTSNIFFTKISHNALRNGDPPPAPSRRCAFCERPHSYIARANKSADLGESPEALSLSIACKCIWDEEKTL